MVDLLADLNPEQRQAVTHATGPLLIVAGAGTGKTTVITRRIAWLLIDRNHESGIMNHGVVGSGHTKLSSDEVLALTFTDKAAQEMDDRVGLLLPLGYDELWISTFHAFAERMVRAHAIDAGLRPDFRLLTPTESWWLMKKHLDRFSLDYYKPRGNPTKFLHVLLRHFSRAKDEGIGVAEYREYAQKLVLDRDTTIADETTAATAEVAECYRVYEELLVEENCMDFGGLLLSLRDLLVKRPGLRRRYQQQFKEILVDEFQDTNSVQYEIIQLLLGSDRHLSVVADDDQAIYRWRGASMGNVLRFIADVPDTTIIALNANYRSAQNILDTAYRFIQHNNPHRLEAQLADGIGGVLAGVTKKLRAPHDRVGVIGHLHATTEAEEARLVAEKIVELKSKDPERLWSDFAILVRSNSDAESFVRALSIADIPFQYLAARGLYRAPIVLDLVAYLRVIHNRFDSQALWRVLNIPVVALDNASAATITESLRHRGDMTLVEVLQGALLDREWSESAREEVGKVLQWIEEGSTDARTKPVGTVLLNFLERSGYLAMLTESDRRENLDALLQLRQFFSIIERFSRGNEQQSVASFVEYLDLALASGDEGSLEIDPMEGPDTVKILTVHSAKGLEFLFVFLVHLVDRRFPTSERSEALELPAELHKHIDASEGDWHLHEERRLFYVGMTRAKEGLFFTSAEDYGGARKKKFSRFLVEAGIVAPDAPPKPTGRTWFGGEGIRGQVSGITGDGPTSASTEIRDTRYEMPPPHTFSYTQIKAYEKCPLQYKFAHVLHLPTRGNPSLSFGKSVHAALEKFFLLAKDGAQSSLFQDAPDSHQELPIPNYQFPALTVLLDLYEQSWIPEWYASKEEAAEFKARGQTMLEGFYAAAERDGWPNVWAIEKPFAMEFWGLKMKGKIDRIDHVGSLEVAGAPSVEIVDYKTGRSPKTDAQVDRDQLLLYQLAAKNVLGAEPKKLTFHYLEDQKRVSFLGSEEDLTTLQTSMTATAENIRSGDFHPTPAANTCGFCDFKAICQYRILK